MKVVGFMRRRKMVDNKKKRSWWHIKVINGLVDDIYPRNRIIEL